MYTKRRMVFYGFEILAGILIFILSLAGVIDNFWLGFGASIASVAIIRIIQGVKYHKDKAFAKSKDIKYSDERTLFIAQKAKSFAFYISILALAVAGLVFQIAGHQLYCHIVITSLCGMLVIYYVSYILLSRKY